MSPRQLSVTLAATLFFAATQSPARSPSLAFVAAAKRQASPSQPSSRPATERLALREIFKMPIGPRGLEFSERARSLADKYVEIEGYLIAQSAPVKGQVLLGPMPMQLHEHEYGFAEDLPATIVHVVLCDAAERTFATGSGLVRVYGVLRLGARNEPDGRVSYVRLEATTAAVYAANGQDASAALKPAEPGSAPACGHRH